jgi:hypothetical protein
MGCGVDEAQKIDITKNWNLLEMFTGDISCSTEVLVGIHKACGEKTEKSTEAEHNEVTDAQGERRFAPEERVLSCILLIGGREFSDVNSIDCRHGGCLFRLGSMQFASKLPNSANYEKSVALKLKIHCFTDIIPVSKEMIRIKEVPLLKLVVRKPDAFAHST